MAEVTRVNGQTQFATGTQRSVAQLDSYVITVLEDDNSTAIDLQAQDGYNAVTGEPHANQLVEAIISELQPVMYFTPSANAGKIHVIVDGHANDATSMQERIRALGATNGTQRNFVSNDGDGTTTTIDIGGTTVATGNIVVTP